MHWTLDHVVAVVDDLEAARAEAERWFGRAPDWTTEERLTEDRTAEDRGVATCEWRTPGGALELLRPAGGAPPEARGPKSLVLGAQDLEAAHEALTAAGLEPGPVTASEGFDARSGARRAWRRFRCPDAHLGGLKLFVLAREEPPAAAARPELEAVEVATGDLAALDELLGARIGLERSGEGHFRIGRTRVVLRPEAAGGPHRITALHVAGQRCVPRG